MNPEIKKESPSTLTLSPTLLSSLRKHIGAVSLAVAGTLTAIGANGCGPEFRASETTVETPDGGIGDSGNEDANTEDASNCDFIKVSVSPTTPNNQTVPKGAANIPWTCWQFENGCKINDISKTTLTTSGNGQNTDLEEMVLTDTDGNILAGPVSLNETAKIEFPENWSLEANTLTDICARVNISPDADANSTHFLSINLPSDIQADIPAEGAFPLKGNELEIANATIGTATVEKNGILTPGPAVGEQFIIGQFSILVDSIEDGQLEQIRVRLPANCGTEDMQNFNLIDQNSPLPIATEPTATASGYATFNLASPLTLNSGGQLDFWATADINCQPGNTIKSCIANDSDIVITGTTYGFQMQVINNHDCQNNAHEVVLQ